jgi:phosphatidylserine decarboxylase
MRKSDKQIQSTQNDLVSIASGKLCVCNINNDLSIAVNQSTISIADLLQNQKLASTFKGGKCLIYRISIADEHEYYFFDQGKSVYRKRIIGDPALMGHARHAHHGITNNTRVINILKTENFGTVAQVEVGELFTGGIKNYQKKEFNKGDAKGHFEFGYAIIFVLFKNNIEIDDNIVDVNESGLDVKVECGEIIGKLKTIDKNKIDVDIDAGETNMHLEADQTNNDECNNGRITAINELEGT